MTEPPACPPSEPLPAQAQPFEFNRPTIISLLYLGGFLTGFSVLIGLALAYAWRNEPHEAWEQSHFTFLIRTVWLGLAAAVICAILSLVLIGLLGFVLIGVWVVIRAVMSLVAAQKHAPIRHPLKLLW